MKVKKNTALIKAMVPPKFKEAVEEKATNEGKTLSDVIREKLEEYLKEGEGK